MKVAKNQEFLAQQNVEELSARTNGGTSHSHMVPLFSEGIGNAQTGMAYEQVKTLEAQIAQLKAPPTAEQLAQLQAAVDAAQEQLAMAKSPYSAHDLAQSESAVTAAQQQLALDRSSRSHPTTSTPPVPLSIRPRRRWIWPSSRYRRPRSLPPSTGVCPSDYWPKAQWRDRRRPSSCWWRAR